MTGRPLLAARHWRCDRAVVRAGGGGALLLEDVRVDELVGPRGDAVAVLRAWRVAAGSLAGALDGTASSALVLEAGGATRRYAAAVTLASGPDGGRDRLVLALLPA